MAVLISGTGSNLQALIDASKDSCSGLGVEIVLVISNKPDVLGLDKAKKAGIETKVSIFFVFEKKNLYVN